MWILYVFALVCLLLLYWWKHFARKPHPKFPDGPLGLPILGYVPIFQAKNILVGLDKLHDKFGNVMSLNLGPSPRIVIIGDYFMLKEVFKDDKSTDRPPDFMMWFNQEFRSGNGHDSRGLLFSVGHEWTEQRRFALRRLRDFGLGKSSMEDMILEEIHQLSEYLDKQTDHPMKINFIFNLSIVNALWTLITGSRLTLDDPKLKTLVESINDLLLAFSNDSPLSVFPSLRHIFPEWTGWIKIKKIFGFMFSFLNEYIEGHQIDFEKNKEIVKEDPNDFIDAYLAKIDDSPTESSFHGSLGIKSLKSVLLDLFFAGIETTSTALSWSVVYMIKYPEVQKKVQKEILTTIGQSRHVRMSDKSNLPYTEAVIQELLRMTCLAPLALPHWISADMEVNGVRLTKGTMVFPNLHRITRNPQAFPNPNEFHPERFLDSNGKYVKNELNIPFGIGKRDCLGKSLALTELFLFFASLMQRYTFTTTKNPKDLDISPIVGLTQSPPSVDVIITKIKSGMANGI